MVRLTGELTILFYYSEGKNNEKDLCQTNQQSKKILSFNTTTRSHVSIGVFDLSMFYFKQHASFISLIFNLTSRMPSSIWVSLEQLVVCLVFSALIAFLASFSLTMVTINGRRCFVKPYRFNKLNAIRFFLWLSANVTSVIYCLIRHQNWQNIHIIHYVGF